MKTAKKRDGFRRTRKRKSNGDLSSNSWLQDSRHPHPLLDIFSQELKPKEIRLCKQQCDHLWSGLTMRTAHNQRQGWLKEPRLVGGAHVNESGNTERECRSLGGTEHHRRKQGS